jgi:hypothetical protein
MIAKVRGLLFALGLLLIHINGLQGQSPYDFLQLGISARTAGLAGAFVSVAEDPAAVFINPAAIGTVNESRLSFTLLKHALDINSGAATYMLKPGNTGERISVSALFTSYGSFDRTDNNGAVTGSFSASNLALSATYSNVLDSNLTYGFTGKLIYASLADASSMAIAADAGVLYRFPKSRTNIGFSILNIGTQLSRFNGYSESLPVDVRLGINHRLRGLPLLINFSFHHLADEVDVFFDRIANFSVGGEIVLSKVIDVRVGYDNVVRDAVSTEGQRKLSGFSAGLGIKTKPVLIDYALSSLGSAATLHRLSINFSPN